MRHARKANRAIAFIIVVLLLVLISAYLAVSGTFTQPLDRISPVRSVGERVFIRAEVTERDYSQQYAVVVMARVILSNSSSAPVGSLVRIQFSGIGGVSSWKSYQLVTCNEIQGTMVGVENAYWEMLDTDFILYPKTCSYSINPSNSVSVLPGLEHEPQLIDPTEDGFALKVTLVE